MQIVGIIAEYNPFHAGHQYHIEQARKLTGADGVIVVMSGSFVQRGEPAIVDKYARTAMALANGADVVLELPLSWATGSAERFAQGGVHILHRLGIVTHLVCGSEDPDSDLWVPLTELLRGERQAPYREVLQSQLKAGLSYPAARAAAAEAVLPGAAALLEKPNNILALEYRKAIAAIPGCEILPMEIRRVGSGYHDRELTGDEFPSASGIRSRLLEPSFDGEPHEQLSEPSFAAGIRRLNREHPQWMPRTAWEHLRYAIGPDALSSMLQYQLLMSSAETTSGFQDVNPDLANRLLTLAGEHPEYTFSQLADALKTRNITRTRANRALLHTLLQTGEKSRYPEAVRLLGFRRNSGPGPSILRELMDHSQIPIVTKMADAPEGVFHEDIRASHLYNRVVWDHTGIRLKDEFRQGPVIL